MRVLDGYQYQYMEAGADFKKWDAEIEIIMNMH